MESVHAGKRPFFCGPCDQKFASKQILERHMSGIHGKILSKPENINFKENENFNKSIFNNELQQIDFENQENYDSSLESKKVKENGMEKVYEAKNPNKVLEPSSENIDSRVPINIGTTGFLEPVQCKRGITQPISLLKCFRFYLL